MTRAEREARQAAFAALPETDRAAIRERIRHLLGDARWHHTTTMPDNPHEYTVRKQWTIDEDFIWVVECIRGLGYQQKYNGRYYTVLDCDGYYHWTLNWPVGSLEWGWPRLQVAGTVLINRKPLALSPHEGKP